MKTKLKKHLLLWVLVVFAIVSAALATSAADSTTNVIGLEEAVAVQVQDISSYRVEGDFKAPDAPEGYSNYIFAGWYTDDKCTKALAKDVTSTTLGEDKSAYAKFVPEEVLSVRAQVTSGTQATKYNTDKATIRFVTTVDSLNYETVGFDIVHHDGTTAGTTYQGESQEVYKKLYVLDSNGKIMNYTPWNIFSSASKYFMACYIEDVANDHFGHGFEATPYWVTLDGTKVTGVTAIKTINMGYMPLMTKVQTPHTDVHYISRYVGDVGRNVQGGCTDGRYYYQALITPTSIVDDTNARAYIRKYDMVNKQVVATSADLNIHHGNDITYNPDLKFGNRTGLLVVIHNTPVYNRLSFINPDNLTIVDPWKITDLDGKAMSWAWTENKNSEYLYFGNASIIGNGIYSMEYNSTHKKYVVGISGLTNGQRFTFLDETMAEIGDIYKPSPLTYNFTTQGNAADDGYIYFVLHCAPFVDKDAGLEYDTHVISVFDWDGNFVTVLQVPDIDKAWEVENISLHNNDIYIASSNGYNAVVFKVSNATYEVANENVASIVRDGSTKYYTSLEAAMMDAEADETITVLKNVEVSSPMEMVVENVTLTNAPGVNVTISRRAAYTGINLINNSAKNFTIKSNTTGSLTFDGTGTQRGASWIVNSVDGELTLENVTVQNVSANQDGGAVCAKSGTVTINGCTFKNNQNSKNGGAIYSSAAVTVNNSVFESNSASQGGAICNYTEKVTINACTFGGVDVGNSATSGGAIYSGGSGTVELLGNESNPVFEENYASGGYGGGAICIGSGTLTVNEYVFRNNTANVSGGAIALRGSSENTITNSIFEGNDAEGVAGNAESGNGGAIHNRGTKPTIRDCEFTGNTALRTGGALYNETTGVVTMLAVGEDLYAKDALFSGNKAGSGGAIAAVAGTVSVNGYTFEVNEAEKKVIDTETTTAEDETETTTDVYSDAQGGAIYAKSATVGTTDCVFTANKSAAQGGAIYNGSSAKTTVTDTKFQQNKAGNDGGAIYNGATLTLKGTKGDEETVTAVFDNNGFIDGTDPDSARGAAIYNGSTLNATAYVFKNNVTTGNGGAICNYGSNPKFTNCQFISNQGAIGGAVYSGGGNKIYLEVSAEAPELTALCEGNIATTRGGAIGVGYGHTYVDGYEFKSNHAPYGGAIYLQNLKETKDDEDNTITVGTDSSITNSIFVGNYTNETGGTTGGAVQVDNGTVDIETSTFNQNSSTTHGGAIYTKAVTGIDGCTFTSNHATSQGGAIKVEGSTAQLNITKTTFGGSEETLGNTAGTSGGAIYNAGSATTTVGTENGAKQATEVFANNKANGSEYGGGAICVGSGILRVYGYAFTDNYAAKEGGAIAKRNTAELIVKDASFESNETGAEGGAIRSYATTSTIENTTFTENIAATRGGAIYTSNITVDLTDSSFNENSAIYGGAINCEGGTLEATSCHFTGNISTADMTTADARETELTGRGGGAVNLTRNATGTFDGTGTFTSNKAENALGGAIYTTDAELSITGYTFSENVAYQAGAILIDNVMEDAEDETLCDTDIEIKDSKFEKNRSTGASGGAIYLNQRKMVLSKTSATAETVFDQNYANGAGGAIKVENTDGAELEVSDYIFSYNDAEGQGGAVEFHGDKVTFTDCKFNNNTADGNGGAFYSGTSAAVTFTVSENPSMETIFQNNSSGSEGGAICLGSGTMDLYGYKFLENSANYGGALTKKANTLVTIQDSQYSLVDAVFENNSATNGGGAIHTTNGTTEITDYTFIKNSATNGGAIWANGGTIKPTDCKFGGDDASLGNTASNEGGAILILNSSTITLTSGDNASMAIFKNNTADVNGGAISVNKGKLYVTGYTFNKNNAKGTDNGGGAIYILGGAGATVELTNSIFTENTANKNGGAICNNGSNPLIKNCKFVGNYSTTGHGGAIYNGWSRKVTLQAGDDTQALFDDNYTTAGYGGAIGLGSGSLDVTGYTFDGNTSATTGGAIHVTNAAENTQAIDIKSSKFETNKSSDLGGAIYIRLTKMTVDDSQFNMNESTGNSGGAISIDSITVEDKVVVRNSTFEQNIAAAEGSSINMPTGVWLTLENCQFSDGITKQTNATYSDCGFGDVRVANNTSAGGLKISGKMVVDVYFNQAGPLTVSGALTDGSAVVGNWRKDKVTGDTFTGINFASEEVMNASKGYITLSDNQNSNYIIDFAETTGTLLKATKVATAEELDAAFTAISGSDDKTGIIVLTDDITIAELTEFPTDCTITVRDDGTARSFIRSADYTGYMLSVPSGANVTFVSTSGDNAKPSLMVDGGNVACTAGNTLLENKGTLTVNQGVALQNNQTSGGNQGIALYSQPDSNTTFKGAIRNITSTLESGSNPSSVAVKGAVTFENAVVENNVTNNNGMLRVFSGGSLTANNTEFKNNTAGAHGGAFNIESGAGTVSFTGCTFTNNHANGGDGGAIYNYGADTNIINCKFDSNTASARGGVIYSGGSVTVDITGDGTDNSIFSNNAASGAYGGAIAIGSGKLVIENYKFDTNTAAAGQGGAVCVTGSGSNYSTITSCNFISNSAKEGGALHVGNSGKVTVNTSEFTTNSATTNGGAVSNNGGGAFNIYTSTFTTNSTTTNGGAIYVNCTGTVLVEDSEFVGNKTTVNSGGAIYVYNISTITVNTSSFSENYAKNKGGAICCEAGTVRVNTCDFISNDAASDGGAIRIAGNIAGDVSDVELNGGKFEGNTSGGAGGAIKFNSGSLEVTGYVFTGNTATGGGNALSTNGAGATLTSCTFKAADVSGSGYTDGGGNTLVTEEE